MSMFPGAGAQVYYNEAGEPIGWDYPNTDPPEPSDDDDRYADYMSAMAEEAYEYGKEAEVGDTNPYEGEDKHLAATWQAGYDDGHSTFPRCSEGGHVNDDNPGNPMCKTCEEWAVTE